MVLGTVKYLNFTRGEAEILFESKKNKISFIGKNQMLGQTYTTDKQGD
jgi:hypothetical protein